MSEPILRLDDVSVHHGGIVAVDGITLDIAAGTSVGIIGPNGAGKTSLLDAVCGFVAAAGRVRLDGVDLTPLLPWQRARAGLGRSFQDARLYPTMTVRETLVSAFHARHRSGVVGEGIGVGAARREARRIEREAEALLALVDLDRYLDHLVAELSFGTTRAVELAWVAAMRPAVLLLDEPASGLQQSEVAALGPLLERIRGEAVMVVIDHDVPFVAALADRLIAMDLGRVVADGDPTTVLGDPMVIESYLGTAPPSMGRA